MQLTSHIRRGLIVASAAVILSMPAAPASAQATPAASDSTVEDQIAYRLETNEQLRRYDVSVDVASGVATLKGTVATAAQKAEAERLARVATITKVTNNIAVDADADKTLTERTKAGLSKTGQKIDDAWITTKVKWFIMRDDLLDNSEVNVDTRSNVVTLKGTVTSEAARVRAQTLAKQTEGVARVVDELTVGGARKE